MTGYDKKSFQRLSVAKIVLLGLLALGGPASPVRAQSSIQGKFTLPFAARWGNKVLAAGTYTYSIEPLAASIQNVSSIQSGYHPVLVVVRPEPGGPASMVIAMATSQKAHVGVLSRLVIETTADGPIVRTMRLEEFGIVLDFKTSKPKTAMYARGPAPSKPIASSKGSL